MISITNQQSSLECMLIYKSLRLNQPKNNVLEKVRFFYSVNSKKKYYKILFLNKVHHKIQLIYNNYFQKQLNNPIFFLWFLHHFTYCTVAQHILCMSINTCIILLENTKSLILQTLIGYQLYENHYARNLTYKDD